MRNRSNISLATEIIKTEIAIEEISGSKNRENNYPIHGSIKKRLQYPKNV